ncbi:MAG: hypothetical protein DMD33_18780 [Gemmatimonadetes bacterium]|nr:MAG: hypothetical protein DMD33_18780 [Gemmatimonadota bacterium]
MTAAADLAKCKTCGSYALAGTVCPRSLACPHCKAEPGSPCKRPSGHRAATIHAGRYHAAETIDRAAGITYPEQVVITEALP